MIDGWPPLEQALRNVLRFCQLSVPEEDWYVGELASIVRDRCGPAILPEPTDSLALSVMRPKTAALAYDKVYKIPFVDDPVPEELAFFGQSRGELACAAVTIFLLTAPEVGIPLPQPTSLSPPEVNERRSLRQLSGAIGGGIGREPTVFYERSRDQNQDFQPGPERVLEAALRQLDLVREEELSWRQVLEFREDKEARRMYRRLVRWISTKLKASTPQELVGEIEDRLEEYQWAVRKHGLKTGIGALSALIDPKFVGALSGTMAAAGFAAGTVGAGVAGTVFTAGRVLVSIGAQYLEGIEERRGENYEIAYLHEVERRM